MDQTSADPAFASSRLIPLGKMTSFYVPSHKLDDARFHGDGHTPRFAIHEFLMHHYRAYTQTPTPVKGFWVDPAGVLVHDVLERFEVSFDREQDFDGLIEFLVDLCDRLSEEAIYVTRGERSFLVAQIWPDRVAECSSGYCKRLPIFFILSHLKETAAGTCRTSELYGNHREMASFHRFATIVVLLGWTLSVSLDTPGWSQSPGLAQVEEVETDSDADFAALQLKTMREDVAYLASEALRGRSVADDSILLAADYLAARMAAIGLDTSMLDGKPFQPVSIRLGAEAGPAENNRLVVRFGDQPERAIAELGDDLMPLAVGSNGGQLTGPLAFVGYGITAPKYGYDDYAGVNVRGATVIIIRKEPQSADPNSKFDGTRHTRHAFFYTKIKNAIQHGASAVVFVNDPASIEIGVQEQSNRIDAEQKRQTALEQQIAALPQDAVNNRETLTEKVIGIQAMLESMQREKRRSMRGVMSISEAGDRPEGGNSENVTTIPVVSVARDLIDSILVRAMGKSIDEIESSIDMTLVPESRVLPDVSATLGVSLKEANRESPNVIGVLEGRGDLAEQTIIVGAHYDHVGMGGVGSLAPGRSRFTMAPTTMRRAPRRCWQRPLK